MYHWWDENGDLWEARTLSGYGDGPVRIPGEVAIELLQDRQRRIRERLDELAEMYPQLRKEGTNARDACSRQFRLPRG